MYFFIRHENKTISVMDSNEKVLKTGFKKPSEAANFLNMINKVSDNGTHKIYKFLIKYECTFLTGEVFEHEVFGRSREDAINRILTSKHDKLISCEELL